MKNEIPVAIFEATKSHSHPALYVSGKKNEATVFDDKLEVRVEELEDEVQIFLGRENIKNLVVITQHVRIIDYKANDIPQ